MVIALASQPLLLSFTVNITITITYDIQQWQRAQHDREPNSQAGRQTVTKRNRPAVTNIQTHNHKLE